MKAWCALAENEALNDNVGHNEAGGGFTDEVGHENMKIFKVGEFTRVGKDRLQILSINEKTGTCECQLQSGKTEIFGLRQLEQRKSCFDYSCPVSCREPEGGKLCLANRFSWCNMLIANKK